MVGAGNSFDPGPVWLRHEAKRADQWRRQPPIGEEIRRCNRHDGCFLNTARTDGIYIKKGRGAGIEAQKNRGPHGSAVRWGGVRWRGSVRDSAAAATGILKTPCGQVGDREASSRKKKALGVVAEARLMGTASTLRSLFERRQYEILPSSY